MKAIDFLKEKEKNIHYTFEQWGILNEISELINEYAKIKCVEQKEICGKNLQKAKAPLWHDGIDYILNAPLPNFE